MLSYKIISIITFYKIVFTGIRFGKPIWDF